MNKPRMEMFDTVNQLILKVSSNHRSIHSKLNTNYVVLHILVATPINSKQRYKYI